MLILGIDPGTATTGWGVLKYENGKVSVKSFGLVETDKEISPGKRLIDINEQFKKLLKLYKPDVVAIEKLFFATNAKTAMNVGAAIGVIMYTIALHNLEIFEYAPGTIKKNIAGSGRADKKMIQKSLRTLLGPSVRSRKHSKTHFDNSADALAVAFCHTIAIGGGD